MASALSGPLTGLGYRLWPNLKYLACNSTGSFEVARPRLQLLTDAQIPIVSRAYTASESMIGLELDPGSGTYVLAAGAAYFEFIAVNDQEEPDLLPMDQLEIGARYEVVITTPSGLYRYRLGDIIDVVGFMGEAPILKFSHRRGIVLNLVGEKTNEQQLRLALELASTDVLGESGLLMDFAASGQIEKGTGKYIVYAEFGKEVELDKAKLKSLGERFDQHLCQTNPTYFDCARRSGYLDTARIEAVASGTFELLKQAWCEDRKLPASNNRKLPAVVDAPAVKNIFSYARVPESRR